MDENKKAKAVLVELFQNDGRNDDGSVRKGEVHRYWYKWELYPEEVLDLGKYWEACADSTLWPATPDGVTVLDSLCTLSEFLDVDGLDDMVAEARELEPGQWVEREFPEWNQTGCRVRATAYAEFPPLSAEETIRASDLTNKAMARIRVNGKTLYAYGTMERGSRAWFPDFQDFVAKAVVDRVRERGGPTAEVSLRQGGIELLEGGTAVGFDLKARSREGLVEFLRNLGVANPDTVRVTKTVGDASGVTCVCAAFTCADFVDD